MVQDGRDRRVDVAVARSRVQHQRIDRSRGGIDCALVDLAQRRLAEMPDQRRHVFAPATGLHV